MKLAWKFGIDRNDGAVHSRKRLAVADHGSWMNPLHHGGVSSEEARTVLPTSICRDGDDASFFHSLNAALVARIRIPTDRRNYKQSMFLPICSNPP